MKSNSSGVSGLIFSFRIGSYVGSSPDLLIILVLRSFKLSAVAQTQYVSEHRTLTFQVCWIQEHLVAIFTIYIPPSSFCHCSTESSVRQSLSRLYTQSVPLCFVLLFISSRAFVFSLGPFATTGNNPMIVYKKGLEFDSSTRASTIHLVLEPSLVFVHPFFVLHFFSRTRHSSTYRPHVIACRPVHLHCTLHP